LLFAGDFVFNQSLIVGVYKHNSKEPKLFQKLEDTCLFTHYWCLSSGIFHQTGRRKFHSCWFRTFHSTVVS